MSTAKLSDYDIVIEGVYEQLIATHPQQNVIPFEKSLIEHTAQRLALEGKIKTIRNIPDIKYSYDARREFPSSMVKDGYWAICGTGKGRYELRKLTQNNLVRIPSDLLNVVVPHVTLVDNTHPLVAKVLGSDEQATLRRIEANNLIDHFLGMPSYRLQGHERTSLSCGQIEVDEVYVASDGISDYVIPISGKGGDADFLSYTQALNLSLYALEKPKFKHYTGRPLGVWQQPGGPIYVLEFSCSSRIEDIRIVQAKAYTIVCGHSSPEARQVDIS